MNDLYNPRRSVTARRSHIRGLVFLVVATILAVITALVMGEWSKHPGNPGDLFARLLGGSSISLDTSSGNSGTPQADVPRSRPGLVATGSNRGQILFGRYCDSCHTGGREMIGPSLVAPQFKSQYKSADKIMKLVRTGGFDMPAYPATLVSDDELRLIAEYILSLPEEKP
jgi:cytochrome c551/c552